MPTGDLSKWDGITLDRHAPHALHLPKPNLRGPSRPAAAGRPAVVTAIPKRRGRAWRPHFYTAIPGAVAFVRKQSQEVALVEVTRISTERRFLHLHASWFGRGDRTSGAVASTARAVFTPGAD